MKLSNPRLPFLPNVSSVFNPSRPDTANNYFPVFTVSSTKHVRMNLKKLKGLTPYKRIVLPLLSLYGVEFEEAVRLLEEFEVEMAG